MAGYNITVYKKMLMGLTSQELRDEYDLVCRKLTVSHLVRKANKCIFCDEGMKGKICTMCSLCQQWDHEACIYEDPADASFQDYHCPVCKPGTHDGAPGFQKRFGLVSEKEDNDEDYVPEYEGAVANGNVDMVKLDSDEDDMKDNPYRNLPTKELVHEIVKKELALQRCKLEEEHRKRIVKIESEKEKAENEKRNCEFVQIAMKQEILRLREQMKDKDEEMLTLKEQNKRLRSAINTERNRKRPRVESVPSPSQAWRPPSPKNDVASPTYSGLECIKCNQSFGPLQVCSKCHEKAIHSNCASRSIGSNWLCVECRGDFSISGHKITSIT